jgi:TonB family protein
VTSQSGIKELDDEAIRAFRTAGPFPPPPEGLVARDDLVTFPFSFFFEIGGSHGERSTPGQPTSGTSSSASVAPPPQQAIPEAQSGPATTTDAQIGSAAPTKGSKVPLPINPCIGRYTPEARAAATEGVVVLDLVVDELGRTRDIAVVEGLPHGLNESAIAAVRECRFVPGEKDGRPVPVRIRGFKVRFLLQPMQ